MYTIYARNIIRRQDDGLPAGSDGDEAELFSIPNQNGNKHPFATITVSDELGGAGSCEFSVPVLSPHSDIWKHMRTLIRVVYDENTIFYGRVLTIDRDHFRTRKIHCEGAYTFFNDSIFEGTKSGWTEKLSEYLSRLITNHNQQMASMPEKQIFLGKCPGHYDAYQGILDEQKLNGDDTQKFGASRAFKETKSWLEEIAQDYGGFMRVRYADQDLVVNDVVIEEAGKLYLDWMKTYINPLNEGETMQEVSVTSNAVDLSDTVEVNNIFTYVLPVGKNNKTLTGSGSGGGGGGSGGGGDGNKHTITVTPYPLNGGCVSASTYSAAKGVRVSLTAVAIYPHMFSKWEMTSPTAESNKATINSDSFIMPDVDVSITGYFVHDGGITQDERAAAKHEITVNKYPSNVGGSVTCVKEATPGTDVVLTPHPPDNYVFDHWEVNQGNVFITNNHFYMRDWNVVITCCFVSSSSPSAPHNVSATVSPTYNAQTAANSVTLSASSAANGEYVNLIPIPDSKNGYRFDHWEITSGDATLSGNQLTVGSNDVVVKGVFTQSAAKYSTTIRIVPSDAAEYAYASPSPRETGKVVALLQKPNDGYQFMGWTVLSGGVTLNGNSFTMGTDNVRIQAYYERT